MRLLIYGAGGSFEGDVLQAALTPWIIQPTTETVSRDLSGNLSKGFNKMVYGFFSKEMRE